MKAIRCHGCGRAITWTNLASATVGSLDPDSEGIRVMVIGCWTCTDQDGPR